MTKKEYIIKLKSKIREIREKNSHKCPSCLANLMYDRDIEDYMSTFEFWVCGDCNTIVKIPRREG